MRTVEELIQRLADASKNLPENIDPKKARRLLVMSECITASLQAYLFRHEQREEG